MNRFLAGPLLCTVLLAACQSAQTQSQQPSVVAVPPNEMTSDPNAPASAIVSPAQPGSATAPAQPVTGDTVFVSKPGTTATAPAAPKNSYNSCHVDGPYIALTFDDGPHPQLTPKLLDILKERGVKATFFVVGQNAAEYPDILKRAVAEGHEIANHSWSHPSLTKLGADGVAAQMNKTNDAIQAAIGHKATLMRPPYGATSANLNKRFAEQFGMKVILWDVDPLDWKYRNAAKVESAILQGTRAGSIILVHDIHPTSVAAMPPTIDALLAKGYKFVTVSELIAMDKPQELVKKEKPADKPAQP